MKIIQKLDPNKVHGQDNISIHMIKICGKSIWQPLRIRMFKNLDTSFRMFRFCQFLENFLKNLFLKKAFHFL